MMKIIKFLKKRKILLALLIPLLFLIVGVATLHQYGYNWDEPFHFYRGQTYLHYYLTGERDFSSLEDYPELSPDCPDWVKGGCTVSPKGAADIVHSTKKESTYENAVKEKQKDRKVWRSFFQSDLFPYDAIIETENGHPAVGGILAAITNTIFYQRLHIMGDIESHHLAEILVSFLLVLGVSIFMYKNYGLVASLVSSVALSSYPLFFAESHFNIKDPLLASFYGLTILCYFTGFVTKKIKHIILSAIFLGLATGVKFNTVFLPLILGPWTLIYLIIFFVNLRKNKKTKEKKKEIKKLVCLLISILFYPFIAVLIFYLLWPYLWDNPIYNLEKIISYYKGIGIGASADMTKYLIKGFNTYPFLWIAYTTPIPVLVLSFVGILGSIKNVLKNNAFGLLALLWLFFPVLRVTWPNTVIYGGVRQIMEYVPALTILSGLGAYYLVESKLLNKFINKKIILVVIFLGIMFSVWEIVKIHPNENVYFNQIIGGLSGAREKNIPYWGNTYGNVYLQGIEWLNENAEPNARLGLPLSTMGNLPKLKLRSDIDFYNRHWSGPAKNGEYEIEMNLNWTLSDWYSFTYYDVYLNPVFEVNVDGVPILKIWKNTLENTREGYEEEKEYKPISVEQEGTRLIIDMGKEIDLTRLTIVHSSVDCQTQVGGYISTSTDEVSWSREVERIDYPQVPPETIIFDKNNFVFLFPGKKARYIAIESGLENPCIFKNKHIEVRGLVNPL